MSNPEQAVGTRQVNSGMTVRGTNWYQWYRVSCILWGVGKYSNLKADQEGHVYLVKGTSIFDAMENARTAIAEELEKRHVTADHITFTNVERVNE